MTRFAAWGACLSLAGMASSVWAAALPDTTTTVNLNALSRGDQFEPSLEIAAQRSTGNTTTQQGQAGGVPEPVPRIALISGLLLLGKIGWRRTGRA